MTDEASTRPERVKPAREYPRDVASSGSPSTRARIVSAARAEFGTRGYVDTTVEHIVQASGVSRGTFYYYFKHREDVFEAVARDTLEHLLTQSQHPATGVDRFHRILQANTEYLAIWSENRDVMRNIFQLATIEPRFQALQKEYRQRFITRIEASLERAADAGLVGQMDTGLTAYALACMFDVMAYEWLGTGSLGRPEMGIDRMAGELSELWYHSVYESEQHPGCSRRP